MTKLHLVAAGLGVTTVPPYLARVMPPGVALLRVDGAPPEIRRLLVAGLPGAPSPAVRSVTRAIASALAG